MYQMQEREMKPQSKGAEDPWGTRLIVKSVDNKSFI